MMRWAHGHQIKAISKFALAIIDKQTGNQAELARAQGKQEAATNNSRGSFTTRGSTLKTSPNGFAYRFWPIRSRVAVRCAGRLIGRVKVTSICSSPHSASGCERCPPSGALIRKARSKG